MIEEILYQIKRDDPNFVAVDKEFLLWGGVNEGQVFSPAVPIGKIWLVRAAGVFGNNSPGEYMLQIERPVWSQGGVCCWKIPIARTTGSVNGTPYLSLDRPLVMHEAEKMSARVNGLQSGKQIGLNMLYYEIDADKLPVVH